MICYLPNEEPLPKARELWNLGRRDEALELFLSASRAQKKNLAASLDAARALGASYRIREAERMLLDLRVHLRQIPALGLQLGQVLREIRRPEKALAIFQSTLAALPQSLEATLESAQILERQGQFVSALQLVQQAIKTHGAIPLLRLFEARLVAESNQKAEAITLYQEWLKDNDSSEGLRARAMHELAQLLERENPEEAIRLVHAAHALMTPGAEPLQERGRTAAKKALQLGEEINATFLAELKNSLPEKEQRKLLFLLGFARSGTTLVEKHLTTEDHLDDAEELDLFGLYVHPLLTGTLGSYLRNDEAAQQAVHFLRKRYLKGMQEYFGRTTDEWIVDKNPSHTIICASLARVFPEAKFLVVLRDPRDALLSAYFQFLPLNPESAAFLTWDTLVERYVDTMSAWLDLREKLDPEDWREVRYEQFTKDPETHINQLRQWLGKASVTASDTITGHVSSPSHAEVRRPAHSENQGRWKRHEALFNESVRETLEPIMTRMGYRW